MAEAMLLLLMLGSRCGRSQLPGISGGRMASAMRLFVAGE